MSNIIQLYLFRIDICEHKIGSNDLVFVLQMSDVGLTENESDETKFEIWWYKRGTKVIYTLQSSSAETKRLWIVDIKRLLWKQAIRYRERRLNEMNHMGLGGKPSIELSSKNNIQDRLIKMSLSGKSTNICGF